MTNHEELEADHSHKPTADKKPYKNSLQSATERGARDTLRNELILICFET